MSSSKIKSVDNNHNTAYVLLTVHGAIHSLKPMVLHDLPINVYKLNAVVPGVCNFVQEDVLRDMGKDLKSFISQYMDISPDKMARELQYLIPALDVVYNESVATRTRKTNKSKKSKKTDIYMNTRGYKKRQYEPYKDNIHVDKSIVDEYPELMHPYIEKSEHAYSLTEWKEGDFYHDKHYTIHRYERSETYTNIYDNTVILLGDQGFEELDLVKMHHNTRSQASEESDDIRFTTTDILKELHDKGYTDVVMIDLTCAVGENDRDGRKIRRTFSQDVKRGGKSKTKRRRKHNGKTKRRCKTKKCHISK